MGKKYNSAVCFIRKYYLPGENNEPIIIDKENLTNQIAGFNEKSIKATYLLQYDALVDGFYSETVRKEEKEHNAEIGIWLEIVRNLAEDSNVKFLGREHHIWDPFANAGFSCAYNENDRKRLVDCIMNKFKSVYGCYPKTIGSWIIDSQTMKYISEKYSPDVFVICRSQWGMDGYTLWGGPYYGLYYPSKNNMLCPAQTPENQINTPVLRMFVNDPIYAYYEHEKKDISGKKYELFTQEPAWQCGSSPLWIKWHYDTLFKENCIGYAYTQLGQENSFGWKKIENGFNYQLEFASKNKDFYGYEFATLSEIGRKFKEEYISTPITGRFVIGDWENNDTFSLWYNSKYYRVNLCIENENLHIRDIHLFDEKYQDQYLKNPCTEKNAVYSTLPIMDGVRFGRDDRHACFDLGKCSVVDVSKKCNSYVVLANCDAGDLIISMEENQIKIKSSNDFSIKIDIFNDEYVRKYGKNYIEYKYYEYSYKLYIKNGYISYSEIFSDDSIIVLSFEEGNESNV